MTKDRIICFYLSGVPGLGQLYLGQKKKGFFLLSCWLVLSACLLIFGMGLASEAIRPERLMTILEVLLGVLLAGIYVFSFYDSVILGNESDGGASGMSEAERAAVDGRLRGLARDQVGYVPDLSQRIPEGGFKRKVKGTPKLEPLPPLPDGKDQKSG